MAFDLLLDLLLIFLYMLIWAIDIWNKILVR
jgi:hypothetical protein